MKRALILSGGGMSCSYAVGVLSALIKEYKLTSPELIIAGSGNSGIAAYYVANQYPQMIRVWTSTIVTKKFINYLRFWKIVDVDYLIDWIFKKEMPLNIKKVRNSKTLLLLPVTNYDTGKVEYLSNKSQVDLLEALRAAEAVPIVYRKIIEIMGKRYVDTKLSADPHIGILKALELGATQLIVIDCRNPSRWVYYCFRTWLAYQSKKFKKNYFAKFKRIQSIKIPKKVKMVVLKPKKLKTSIFCQNLILLNEMISQGYEDVCQNNELKQLLRPK
ncbi:MAG: patatin-like phospholipase family protein [Nanoarchaeota archaeon]